MAHCCALYLWVHTCLLNQQAPLWFDLGISSGWNISSTDSHSPTKVLSLWILKNFPNLLDNLHLKCSHEFLPLSSNTLPLVRMKLNKKNGPQDRSWGEKHVFRGWGCRSDNWRGEPWSQASPTSQKDQTQPSSTQSRIRILLNVPWGRDGGGRQAVANLA